MTTKLTLLSRMAADTVDRAESGDPSGAEELRAYMLANAGDVATVLDLDTPVLVAFVEAEATHWADPSRLARAVLARCKDKRVIRGERKHREAAKDTEADMCAAVVVATSWADAGGLHLDGPALLALARASRAPLLAFRWSDRLPGVQIDRAALRALAGVHDPSTWEVTTDGTRLHVRVTGRPLRLALGRLHPDPREHATQVTFADATSCEPMPSSFADEGQEAGALASYDCAAE